jgi:hypothetical protein
MEKKFDGINGITELGQKEAKDRGRIFDGINKIKMILKTVDFCFSQSH